MTRAFLLASLVALVVSPAAAITTDPGLIEGLAAAGKLDEAIAAGRAGVSNAPGNPDLRLALAKALAAKARRLERVIEVPGSPTEFAGSTIKLEVSDFKNAKIVAGYDAALYEEALLHLAEGSKRAPARKDLRMLRCFLLTDGARLERAAAAIRDAIAALPKEPGLATELARFGAERTKRGDPAGGATLLGIVAAAFPENAAVAADHGLSLARLGRSGEALAALDRAVARSPKDVGLLRRRALAAVILRDYPRARAAYDAAFAASRSDEDRFGSAVALYGLDPRAAAEAFAELAQPAPSADPAGIDLAVKFSGAARDPGGAAAVALADEAIASGNVVLAIPVLDRLVRARPADAALRAKLADVFRTLEAPALAEGALKAPRG